MIDGQNQTVLAKKVIDMIPGTVAVNSAQSRIYVVGNNGANRIKDRLFSVMVLDANTLEPLAQIPLIGKEDAIYMAVSPDDAQVWVTAGENEVVLIDTASNTVSQEITVQAGGLSPLVFGANPRMAYVGGRSNLIRVDTSSNPPSFHNIHMMAGRDTHGLALNAAGDRAYVAKDGLGLEIYNLANGKRLASAKTNKYPGNVALHPDGSRIYVVNPTKDSVEVVDAKTFAVIKNIPVGNHPIVFGNFIQPVEIHELTLITMLKFIVISLLGAFVLFKVLKYFWSILSFGK